LDDEGAVLRRKSLECVHILSRIDLGGPHWLIAGMHKVLGVAPEMFKKGVRYS